MQTEQKAGDGPSLSEELGLADLAMQCAGHCREGLLAPNILQNEQGCRLNAAMLLEQCAQTIRLMRAELQDFEADRACEERCETLEAECERIRGVWEDTRTQRDELLAHLAGKAPLPRWAADWLRA